MRHRSDTVRDRKNAVKIAVTVNWIEISSASPKNRYPTINAISIAKIVAPTPMKKRNTRKGIFSRYPCGFSLDRATTILRAMRLP